MKKITNLIFRAILGGLLYMGIEVAYDNSSDRSMGAIGAICFVVGDLIDSKLKHTSYFFRALIMSIVITVLEFIGGLIFNSDYSIWDYRNMKIGNVPLHMRGQVCIPFMLIWLFIISPIIFWLNDKLEDEDVDILDYYKRLIKKNKSE